MFTICLHQEVKEYNIKVQCLTPFFIETKMITDLKPIIKSILNMLYKALIPDPETFVKSAMYTLSTDAVIATGYWPHTLVVSCIS